MTVLIIRAHKRFGVCKTVKVRRKGRVLAQGLLIELSLEGCRISNVPSERFAFEDPVEFEIEGYRRFAGQVRWQRDGMIGLKLTQALHHGELDALITVCRGVGSTTAAALRA